MIGFKKSNYHPYKCRCDNHTNVYFYIFAIAKSCSMKKLYLIGFIAGIFSFATAQTPLTTAIQFEAKDYNGVPHSLQEYLDEGKFVMLSFYTMNCGSCQTYSPHVNQTYENFGCNNGGVIVLGVNWGATNNQLLLHHQQNGLNYPALSGLEGYGNEITSDYQIESFITVILINPDGEIVNQYIYPPTTAALDSILLSQGLSMMDCTVGTDLQSSSRHHTMCVHPNPAVTSFKINMHTQSGLYYVSLYDLHGKRVRDFGLHAEPFPVFALTGLKPGLYIIKAWNNETDFFTTRLLVTP